MRRDAAALLNARALKTIGEPVAYSRANGAGESHGRNGPTAGRMEVVSLIDVRARCVGFLWKNRLPLGKIVVVDGPPGQGKSSFTIDIGARGSRGSAMPDGTRESWEPWDTLILTYEDDAADTLRPRSEAAGADLSRIHHVAGVAYNDSADLLPPSLPKDLAILEQTLKDRSEIRLVVVDPLSAALSADVDSHRDQDVRRVLSRLARIAQECNVCIVLIRHLRKSRGDAITAGGGSIGIIGQSRVGLVVGRHPEDKGASVLAGGKSNVGPLPPSLSFKVVPALVKSDDGDIETSKLEWLGESSLTADELIASMDEGPADNQDAADWLRQILGKGQVERRAVMKAASDAGFPERTIDRAAKRIGATKRREGFGTDMRSYWALSSASSAAQMTGGNGGNDEGEELL